MCHGCDLPHIPDERGSGDARAQTAEATAALISDDARATPRTPPAACSTKRQPPAAGRAWMTATAGYFQVPSGPPFATPTAFVRWQGWLVGRPDSPEAGEAPDAPLLVELWLCTAYRLVASRLGSPLRPGRPVLTQDVSGRWRSAACVRATASPNEVRLAYDASLPRSASQRQAGRSTTPQRCFPRAIRSPGGPIFLIGSRRPE